MDFHLIFTPEIKKTIDFLCCYNDFLIYEIAMNFWT